jgi:hypothetical protein
MSYTTETLTINIVLIADNEYYKWHNSNMLKGPESYPNSQLKQAVKNLYTGSKCFICIHGMEPYKRYHSCF